jgi:hypothetical protein
MAMQGPILHLIFPTCDMIQRTLVRPQEFYESPIMGIRGCTFSFEEYVQANKVQNGGHYLYDWTGYNIPGYVVNEFFERFHPLSQNEELVRLAVESLGSPEKFYLIGTGPMTRTPASFAHELCHARWHLDPLFRVQMTEHVEALEYFEPEIFEAFRVWLLNRGYDESVMADECQAYLSTTPREWWTTEDAGRLPLGTAEAFWREGEPFRKIADPTVALPVVRVKMPQG